MHLIWMNHKPKAWDMDEHLSIFNVGKETRGTLDLWTVVDVKGKSFLKKFRFPQK